MRYVVTLVHGTVLPFLSRPSWPQPESTLSAHLADKLHSRIIRPFYWSGRNSAAARHRASLELQEFLRSQLDEYPPEDGARHLVIAHSHGGNVALYALRDPELARRVSGVACLATPFLYVRRRDYRPQFLQLVAHGSIALFFATYLPITLMVNLGLLNFDYITSLRGNVISMLVVAFTFVTIMWTAHLVHAAWVRWGERMHEQCAYPTLTPNQLYILRSSGDEASGLLGAFQFASWMISRLWSLLMFVVSCLYWSRLASWIKGSAQPATRSGWWMRAVPVLFVGIALLAGARVYFWFAEAPGVVFLAGVYAVLTWLAPVALLSLAWVAAAVFWSVCLLPFGPDLVLTSPLDETVAESTPPGEWTVLLLAPEKRSEAGLQHSSLYNDPRALAALTHWIRSNPEV